MIVSACTFDPALPPFCATDASAAWSVHARPKGADPSDEHLDPRL